MHILFFSHYLGTPTTTFIHNDFVNIGSTPNFKASYLCFNYQNKGQNKFTNVIEIPLQRSNFETKLRWKLELYQLYLDFKNKAFGKRATKAIQAIQPDIIHCHFGYEALSLLENCYNVNQQYIVQFHGYDASQKLKCGSYLRKLKKYSVCNNVHFITVSEYMKNELLQAGITPVNTIKVLYCGVDTDFFTAVATPKTTLLPYTFLQVSGITLKKGHIYTLQAFKLFQEQNITIPAKLILAGKDFMHRQIHNYATQHNLLHNVEFVDEVNPAQVKELMQQANCFVHHSVTSAQNDKEGIPTVLMEAMAMNLPVISTLHAGIPELITDKVNGLLVPEKNIDNYAKAMQAMVVGQYNFAPRESILPKFSSAYHTQALIKLYSRISNS